MEKFFNSLLGNKGKIANFIELTRPWNGISTSLFAISGAGTANNSFPDISLIIILFFVTIIVYMAGTCINDVYDIKADSINMPYRPLIRGNMDRKDIFLISYILYTIALLISFFTFSLYFLVVVIMVVLTLIYSVPPVATKNRSLLGNIVLATGTVFASSYSGAVLVRRSMFISLKFFISIAFMTFFFIFFSILKDFKDVYGDKLSKKNTIVVKLGESNARLICLVGTIVFFPFTIYSYYLIFHKFSFIVISVLTFLFLIWIQIYYLNKGTKSASERAWSYGRLGILFFILSILFHV